MRTPTLKVLLLAAGSGLAASAAGAQEPPIARQLADDGERSIVAFDFSQAQSGDTVGMPLPGGLTANIVVERMEAGKGGVLLQGHVEGAFPATTHLSVNGGAAWGTIFAYGRQYLVDTGADGVARVIDTVAAGLQEAPGGDDEVPAPAPAPTAADLAPNGAAPLAIPPGNTVVDIGIFYTPSMSAQFGLGLAARIQMLVDTMNVGLANSNVPISYVLGYVGPITYAENTKNEDMLFDFANGRNNANGDLSAIPGIRSAKGLDIMSAIRRLDNATHDGCGVGFVTGGGSNGQPGTGDITAFSSNGGWNIVSEGISGGFFCSDRTLAHEAGHNMGQTHNRENTENQGVHSFSYGWRVAGSFRTIMAYNTTPPSAPEVPYFSDPAIVLCANQPCGRPIGSPDEANNAESLRLEGKDVSLFRNRTTPIVASVLPSSRAVPVGASASAFATIINAGGSTATQCGVSIEGAPAGSFSYQTTNPAANQATGTPNTPVNIAPNGFQTYVFTLNATAAFSPQDIPVQFFCANRRSVETVSGVNTFFYGASTTPRPDMVAVALTPTSNGILAVPANSANAFVVATSNANAAGTVIVQPDTNGVGLPLALSICQTNPTTGACLSAPGTSVTFTSGAGTTASFAIFATAVGAIPADAATNRVFVRFRTNGVIVGSTSVAVQSP